MAGENEKKETQKGRVEGEDRMKRQTQQTQMMRRLNPTKEQNQKGGKTNTTTIPATYKGKQ